MAEIIAKQRTTSSAVVTTGNTEIDKKLGGGIPLGSLTLVEGQSDSGKSVLVQHLAFGALQGELHLAYYTSENTVPSLISQMASLGMNVLDYFLTDRLRIYPMRFSSKIEDPNEVADNLLDHVIGLPEKFTVVIIDAITNVISHSDQAMILDLFTSVKSLTSKKRTVFLVVHSSAFDENMLIRVRSLCDAHFSLRVEQVGERLIKVLEVAKVRNAERSTGNIVSFDVEPGLGMNIIPISKAKA